MSKTTVKEQVITESIFIVEKRLDEIALIQEHDPFMESVHVELEAIEEGKRLTKLGLYEECLNMLSEAQKKVAKLRKMPDPFLGKYASELFEERLELNRQLHDLKNELVLVQLLKDKNND